MEIEGQFAMAFRLEVSPEFTAQIEAEAREIERLWNLSDRWLAENLLKLAHRAVALYPEHLRRIPARWDTYATTLVWDVVPEIAKRLGATAFRPQERHERVGALSDLELRNLLGMCIANSPTIEKAWLDVTSAPDPWLLLTHEVCNGNPVVFSMDRILPPSVENGDYAARMMRETSRARGFDVASAWRPSMNDWRPEGSPMLSMR